MNKKGKQSRCKKVALSASYLSIYLSRSVTNCNTFFWFLYIYTICKNKTNNIIRLIKNNI